MGDFNKENKMKKTFIILALAILVASITEAKAASSASTKFISFDKKHKNIDINTQYDIAANHHNWVGAPRRK